MSKRSLIACSFTPACFHHERSKSRICASRWDSAPPSADASAAPPASPIPSCGSLMPFRVVGRSGRSVDFRRDLGGGSTNTANSQHTPCLREQPSGEMRLGNAADTDPVRGLPHGQVLRLAEVVDVLESAVHDLVQAIVNLFLIPEIRLDVLDPFEVRNGYASGVCDYVGDDENASVVEDLVGLESDGSVCALTDDAGLDPVRVLHGNNAFNCG